MTVESSTKPQESEPWRRRDLLFGLAAVAAGAAVGGLLRPQRDRVRPSPSPPVAPLVVPDHTDADKFAALRQIDDQKASHGAHANSDTVGFAELRRDFPWLDRLRRTVGFVADGQRLGSALLLDRYGTVLLCAHERGDRRRVPARLFFNVREDGRAVVLDLQQGQVDSRHDLMFASVDPAGPRRLGLLPLQWGRLGAIDAGDAGPGAEIIAVGWPTPSDRLHATRGRITGWMMAEHYHNTQGGVTRLTCKVSASAVSFAGMSGGGVFQDGRCLGMINASSAPGSAASTDFTPIDLIRASYLALYPARAHRAGVTPLTGAAAPAECRADRAAFVPLGRRD